MQVNVLYFGVLKQLFGGERDVVELPGGADVDALLNVLRARPECNPTILRSLAVAVNREYAQPGTLLGEGDEVALLPPVSGGAATAEGKAYAH